MSQDTWIQKNTCTRVQSSTPRCKRSSIDIVKKIKHDLGLQIRKAIIRSDNAGCYNSSELITISTF